MSLSVKLLIIVAALIAGFMGGVKYHVGLVAARDIAQRQSEEKVRARQLDRIDQAATGLEADKARIRTQFRIITKEFDRVVENLCIATCALTMTACASYAPPSTQSPLQANLRQLCPDLQPIPDGSGAAVLRWSLDTIRLYRECQASQARVVESIALSP